MLEPRLWTLSPTRCSQIALELQVSCSKNCSARTQCVLVDCEWCWNRIHQEHNITLIWCVVNDIICRPAFTHHCRTWYCYSNFVCMSVCHTPVGLLCLNGYPLSGYSGFYRLFIVTTPWHTCSETECIMTLVAAAVQAWRPCPLWEPSPSHPMVLL